MLPIVHVVFENTNLKNNKALTTIPWNTNSRRQFVSNKAQKKSVSSRSAFSSNSGSHMFGTIRCFRHRLSVLEHIPYERVYNKFYPSYHRLKFYLIIQYVIIPYVLSSFWYFYLFIFLIKQLLSVRFAMSHRSEFFSFWEFCKDRNEWSSENFY